MTRVCVRVCVCVCAGGCATGSSWSSYAQAVCRRGAGYVLPLADPTSFCVPIPSMDEGWTRPHADNWKLRREAVIFESESGRVSGLWR